MRTQSTDEPLCHPGHPEEPRVLVGRADQALGAGTGAPNARPLRLHQRPGMDLALG